MIDVSGYLRNHTPVYNVYYQSQFTRRFADYIVAPYTLVPTYYRGSTQ